MANKTSGRGQLFQVCTTAQNTDLTPVQFAALAYVDVCCMQDTPEFSFETNMITENCISGERIILPGATAASDVEIAWFYDSGCAGQDSLRTMALSGSNNAYAVRKVYNDGVSGVSTPTTVYGRMVFAGYTDSGIGMDDVQTQTVSGSLVQGPVTVKPASV